MLPRPRRLLRPRDDPIGDPAHGRAVHAERTLGDAVLELEEKGDAAPGPVDVDPHAPVPDLGVVREFFGQRVVVRGEEADAADVRGDVMQHRLRDRHAVVAARAAAEFVEDD